MERDRVKAPNIIKRLEEKKLNQSNHENGLEDTDFEPQPSDEIGN